MASDQVFKVSRADFLADGSAVFPDGILLHSNQQCSLLATEAEEAQHADLQLHLGKVGTSGLHVGQGLRIGGIKLSHDAPQLVIFIGLEDGLRPLLEHILRVLCGVLQVGL